MHETKTHARKPARTAQRHSLPSDDPRIYGVTIEKEVARRALGMGRDSFDAAIRSKAIPSIRVGERDKILGAPFRRMLALPERAPRDEPVAA